MKLHEVLKRYGEDTTSNFDLARIAKDLNVKPFYVVMKDEVKDLRNTPENKIYACSNLHDSDEVGVHWNCFVWDKKDDDNNFFFDSYGLPPVQEIQDLLKHATYTTFELQKRGTRLCGQLSLFVLKGLRDGRDFTDIVFDVRDLIEE